MRSINHYKRYKRYTARLGRIPESTVRGIYESESERRTNRGPSAPPNNLGTPLYE